jgi:hypothetical protein
MKPSFEERLIGVDISDSSDRALIEKNGLQTATRRTEFVEPIVGVKIKWFRTEFHFFEEPGQQSAIRKENHASEPARIAET